MKTRTGASSIPTWHCDFIPCLHEGMICHSAFTWRNTSCRPTWSCRHLGLDVEDCACATWSRLAEKWFHVWTNGRTLFTWHRNEFSYRNENLAPVQLPGWTRSGMRFCSHYPQGCVDHPVALPLRRGSGRNDLVGIGLFFSFDFFSFFWWLGILVTWVPLPSQSLEMRR